LLTHGEQNRIRSSIERMDISATAVEQRLIPRSRFYAHPLGGAVSRCS